ncbi:MAG TPA: hypothetical protein VIO64_21320 [Pseudobacteroides sp.]|uniref:ABC transporter permease subunit n=1 Tax=Pseudobacteroides sp. TaxID=1968840 RepID=UPI002F927890
MSKVFKLSYIELKKYLFSYIALFLLGFTIISIYFLPPFNIVVDKTKVTMLYLLPFIMTVIYSHILSKEFENKTFKVLFTGTLTRIQVVLYKMFTIIEITILFAVLYQALIHLSMLLSNQPLSLNILLKDIMNSIFSFLVYATIVGSFAFFVTSVSCKFTTTFIVTYICFNDFIENFLSIVVDKTKNEIIRSIAENIPFTVTANGFYSQSYTAMQVIILLAISAVLLTAACLIIEKRDFR